MAGSDLQRIRRLGRYLGRDRRRLLLTLILLIPVALAGAVNRSDDLFIHVGFTALKALSPTGQSRPFHANANGLQHQKPPQFVRSIPMR